MDQDELLALQVRSLATLYAFGAMESQRLADFYAFHLHTATPCWKWGKW
jgi:hypothetical protein